jgi:hypothetical protein
MNGDAAVLSQTRVRLRDKPRPAEPTACAESGDVPSETFRRRRVLSSEARTPRVWGHTLMVEIVTVWKRRRPVGSGHCYRPLAGSLRIGSSTPTTW